MGLFWDVRHRTHLCTAKQSNPPTYCSFRVILLRLAMASISRPDGAKTA
jgi:hypothetical protein